VRQLLACLDRSQLVDRHDSLRYSSLIPACVAVVHTPQTLQRYFQQIWPLADCDAEDGRVVGRMLIGLVGGKAKDVTHAVRQFAYRTEMLRDCGLRNIGAMLARLLTAEALDNFAIGACGSRVIDDPSSLTEMQAAAIGDTIVSSVYQSHAPDTALKKVVQSHAVLRVMSYDFVWFVPLLEVLTAHKTRPTLHRALTKQLRLVVVAARTDSVVAPAFLAPNTDGAEDGSFSPVVWLGTRGTSYCSRFVGEGLPLTRTIWTLQAPANARTTREVVDETLDQNSAADSVPSGTVGCADLR
jgi:hypothetical protein